MLQCTLRKEVSFEDVGLHSGQKIKIVLKPCFISVKTLSPLLAFSFVSFPSPQDTLSEQ